MSHRFAAEKTREMQEVIVPEDELAAMGPEVVEAIQESLDQPEVGLGIGNGFDDE